MTLCPTSDLVVVEPRREDDDLPEVDQFFIRSINDDHDALNVLIDGQLHYAAGYSHGMLYTGGNINHFRTWSVARLAQIVPASHYTAVRDWVGERREWLADEIRQLGIAMIEANGDAVRLGHLGERSARLSKRIRFLTDAFEALP